MKKFKILALGALLCLALPQSIFAASVQDDGIKVTTPPVTAVEKQGYQEEWLQREDDPVVRVDQEVKVDIKPLIDQKATNIWLEFYKRPDQASENTSYLYCKVKVSDDGKTQFFRGYYQSSNIKNFPSEKIENYEAVKKYFDPGDVWLKITYNDKSGKSKERNVHLFVDPGDRFLGEVKPEDFINGEELANQIGLTSGKFLNKDTNWLKFQRPDGSLTYVAKQPIKYYISWNHINNAGAVYGDKEIAIKGKKYKIRLLRGYNESVGIKDLANKENEFRGNLNVGSEWNRLLYPLSHHTTNNQNFSYKEAVGSKIPSWANYDRKELGFNYETYNGTLQWCQETTYSSADRLYRGDSNGVSGSYYVGAGDVSDYRGWRPALDFIPQ